MANNSAISGFKPNQIQSYDGRISEDRAGDKIDPTALQNQDEITQLNLFGRFWLYAIPPRDGQDLYLSKTYDSTLGAARRVRRNSRSVFNYIPFILRTTRQLMQNNSQVEKAVKVMGENGQVDENLTALAHQLLRKQWRSMNFEGFNNGLVTGQNYIWPQLQEDGTVFFNTLLPNYVFLTPNKSNSEMIDRASYKFRVRQPAGDELDHEWIFTKDQIIIRQPGEDGYQEETIPNNLGRIPFSHAKQIPVSGELYGQSYISQYISDMDELNQLTGDWIASAALYGVPHVVAKNCGIDINGLKFDVSQIFEITSSQTGVDSDFYLLEYEKLGEQWDKITSFAKEVRMKAPQFIIRDLQGGSAESGYATELKLMELEADVRENQYSHEIALSDTISIALNLVLRPGQQYQEYDVRVDLGDPFPPNIKKILEIEEKKKLHGWTTPEQTLRKLGNSPEEIKEVAEFNEKENSFSEMLAGLQDPKNEPKTFFNPETGDIIEESTIKSLRRDDGTDRG